MYIEQSTFNVTLHFRTGCHELHAIDWEIDYYVVAHVRKYLILFDDLDSKLSVGCQICQGMWFLLPLRIKISDITE